MKNRSDFADFESRKLGNCFIERGLVSDPEETGTGYRDGQGSDRDCSENYSGSKTPGQPHSSYFGAAQSFQD